MPPSALAVRPLKKFRFLPALFAAAALAGAAGAMAAQGFSAGVENGKIIISARLQGSLTPDTIKALSGGTPVTFTYVALVKRERLLMWDPAVRKATIKRIVKYDALKKNYLGWEKRDDSKPEDEINFSQELKKIEYKPTDSAAAPPALAPEPPPANGKPSEPVVMDPLIFPTVKEMEDWVSSTGKADLGPAEGLDSNGEYYVQVRLKVKSVNPAPPIKFILFFLSFLDFDTGWLQSESFNIPPPRKEAEAGSPPAGARSAGAVEPPR